MRPDGYLRVRYKGKNHYVHRLIYSLVTGLEPESVDHINGDRSDNRWVNLRGATKAQNRHNSKRPTTNKTGIKGVSRQGTGYRAEVVVNGVRTRKYFKRLTSASLWVKSKRQNAHGDFSNHGREI